MESLQLIWVAVALAVLSAGSAYALCWAARLVAPRLGFVDKPDGKRKLHGGATPLLGGVAVFGAFLATVAVSAAALTESTLLFSEAGLFISGGLFCLTGLWDDWRGLSARNKVVCQVVASLPFVLLAQDRISAVELFGLTLQLGPFGVAFAVLWLVACANVINLLDGLDGLAASLGFIAAVALAVICVLMSHIPVAILLLILAGSLTGFLIHNWPPARIFLGDAGSLTIGYLIGALSMQTSLKTAASVTLGTPLILLSVPILDTVLAVLRRRLSGKSISQPDRGHIHHRMQDDGMSRVQTLVAISGVSLAMGVTAVGAVFLGNDMLALFVCLATLIVLFQRRTFGHHETLLVLNHIRAIRDVMAQLPKDLKLRTAIPRLTSQLANDRHEGCRELLDGAVALGIEQVELVRTEEQQHVTYRIDLAGGHPPPDATARRRFQYSVESAQGTVIRLNATGALAREQAGGHDQLNRLLEAFCVHLSTIQEFSRGGAAHRVERLPAETNGEHGSAAAPSDGSDPERKDTAFERRAA